MNYANRLILKNKARPGSIDPEIIRILNIPVVPVWSQDENDRFLAAVKAHGNQLKQITEALEDKKYH